MPRKQILVTTPNLVLNDQQFVLEMEQVVLSDVFPPKSVDSTSWTEVCRYYTKDRDLCGTAATDAACPVYFLTWASAAGTEWQVRMVGPGGTTSSGTISATPTSKIWRLAATLSNALATEGTIEEQVISMRRTKGTGILYLGGVGVFSDT
jgi:hypothetical protein